MNYKELIYKNAIQEIERIYKDSQYNQDEDLYRSFDIINSINDAQMASKEWLVSELSNYLTDDYYPDAPLKDILVMGSWYGLTGILLREHINEEVKIWNVDSDPMCERIHWELKQDIPECRNNIGITDDAINYFLERKDAFQLIINTSCEHMEPDDIKLIANSKDHNTMVCFQSNNYHAEPEHINTHDSLDSFVESLDLVRVFYKGEMSPSEEYTRYMVIGI
jgi:hypothetical protein